MLSGTLNKDFQVVMHIRTAVAILFVYMSVFKFQKEKVEIIGVNYEGKKTAASRKKRVDICGEQTRRVKILVGYLSLTRKILKFDSKSI